MRLQGAPEQHNAPASWRTTLLGSVLAQVKRVGASELPLLGVSLVGGVRVRSSDDGRPAASLDLSAYKVVEPGQIVMNALGKPHGSIGRSSTQGITSPAYWVLSCGERLDDRFAHYLLRSSMLLAEYNRLGKYLPPNQFDISWESFRGITVSLPPVEEQRCIADFLDDQVARIDAVIKSRLAQESLVRDEARSELDVLVDRLGDANGWVRLRRWIRTIEQGWSPQCDSVPAEADEWGVLKVGAVRDGAFRSEQNKRLPDDLEPRRESEVGPGDLLFSRANTPSLVGEAAVVPADVRSRLILCDKLFRVRLHPEVVAGYVSVTAGTTRSRSHFSVLSSGSSASMVNIRAEDIQDLLVPVLSIQEQHGVAQRAQATALAIDEAIRGLHGSIGLLNEYKRSLITAAVAGELDVSTARGGVLV